VKKLLVIMGVLISLSAYPQNAKIYPTYPGTSIRDYSKPGMIVKDGNVYQTYPGTDVRDYSKSGYKLESSPERSTRSSKTVNVYPTYKGTNVRDYSKPGYKVVTKPKNESSDPLYIPNPLELPDPLKR